MPKYTKEGGVKLKKITYEKDKKGNDIALIIQENKKIYLNSKYDAYKDMECFLDKFNIKEDSIIILFGLESGVLLEILNNRLSSKGRVICYEPMNELIRNIEKKKKKFSYEFTVISSDEDQEQEHMYLEIKNIFKSLISIHEAKKCVVISQKKYEEIFSQKYKIFLEGFSNALKESQLDLNTLDAYAEIHIRNFLHNMKYVSKSPDLKLLEGIFKNKPAVLVSAGPSLEKNFRLLKGNEDKLVIITGGRTLKVLLEAGINPHFVASMDPAEGNFNLFKDVMESEIPMVCQWLNNYKIVENYKGVKFFINNTYIKNVDKSLIGKELLDFDQGGSVATSQFSLARHLGCNPIAFIGQDLAYTNNKTHADIASYDKKSNEIKVQGEEFLKVKGNLEKEVYIDIQFKYFREWFEMAIQRTKNVKFYNCTEGGAYIKGTEVETLENYIKKYGEEYNYKEMIEKKIYENELENSELKLKNTIKKLVKSIKKVIFLTDEAILIIKKINIKIQEGKDILEYTKRLDLLDKKIEKEESKSQFVVYFIQKELGIIKNIDLENDSEYDEILKINEMFYDVVNKAYKKALEIICEIKIN